MSAEKPSANSGEGSDYRQVTGIIDTRSTFSDGKHTIEELAVMARERGFQVLFINDHDQISLSYGLPPFRNIIRHKKVYPSIITHGAENYLKEIKRVSEKYSDIVLIPGCETSAYYYWTGSWFRDDLTVNEYDRRILLLDLTAPEDYEEIPGLPYRFSFRYTLKLLPAALFFILPLISGIIMIRWKGYIRITGYVFVIISIAGIIDYNPFRNSLFNPYRGDQGIKPWQELIDYANEKGALCFWNYPEQKSGNRRYGPIFTSTPPYPQVLHESKNYTGFSAIYGEYTTASDPGGEWDRVLNEYCSGERKRAVWGISTADFHEEGRLNLNLGSFPTTFLVREFTKQEIMNAIKNGRMYGSRGDGFVWPVLNAFNVSGSRNKRVTMGDLLETDTFPEISFTVSYSDNSKRPVTIELIRGGIMVETFKGETPLKVEFRDEGIVHNTKTYYRLRDNREHLVSNPVFVLYRP